MSGSILLSDRKYVRLLVVDIIHTEVDMYFCSLLPFGYMTRHPQLVVLNLNHRPL